MTEIPEDVMKAAAVAFEESFYSGNPNDVVGSIARAILAEREAQRERDAKIADEAYYSKRSTANLSPRSVLVSYSRDIAAAIRTPA